MTGSSGPIADFRLQQVLAILELDGVIACPTEAVWGLSCNPWSAEAVARLLHLKKRPVEKGLILVAADMAQVGFLLEGLDESQRRKLDLSWPGPNTWLLPHHGRVPPWISGEHDSVAVRVSAHPVMRQLCAAWGGPLVSTSANPAGSQAPRARFQVQRFFGAAVDDIVPGSVGDSSRPSTIRDVVTDRVLRA